MARVRSVPSTKRRHKKFLKAAKGYFSGRSKHYFAARDTVQRGWAYATEHRRAKKRDFRSLWIARISAAVEGSGLTYSRFMNGLRRSNIQLNRKSLSDIANTDQKAFQELVQAAKSTSTELMRPKGA